MSPLLPRMLLRRASSTARFEIKHGLRDEAASTNTAKECGRAITSGESESGGGGDVESSCC